MKHMKTIGEGLDVQFEAAHAVVQLHVEGVMAVVHARSFVGHGGGRFQHDLRRAQVITIVGSDDLDLVQKKRRIPGKYYRTDRQ